MLWSHLEYIDHNTGMNVHGIGIPICIVPASSSPCGAASTMASSRELFGSARVRSPNGVESTAKYDVCMADNGEPGKANDKFSITLADIITSMALYTSGPP